MPRGGARPGAGRPKGGRKEPHPAPMEVQEPRPQFATPLEFGLWALNANDEVVSMDQKIRAMQAMMAHAGKQAAPAKLEAPGAVDDGDDYAPRRVRGFGVVDGDRK